MSTRRTKYPIEPALRNELDRQLRALLRAALVHENLNVIRRESGATFDVADDVPRVLVMASKTYWEQFPMVGAGGGELRLLAEKIGEQTGVVITGLDLGECRFEVGLNGKPPRLLSRLLGRVTF